MACQGCVAAKEILARAFPAICIGRPSNRTFTPILHVSLDAQDTGAFSKGLGDLADVATVLATPRHPNPSFASSQRIAMSLGPAGVTMNPEEAENFEDARSHA